MHKVNFGTLFSIVITPKSRVCAATAEQCKLPKEKGPSDLFRQEIISNKKERGTDGIEGRTDDWNWRWTVMSEDFGP